MTSPSGGVGFALPYDNEDTLEQALRLAAAGVPVFPAHGIKSTGECTCGDESEGHRKNRGKHPATARGHHDATTDPDVIKGWFATPGLNLAFPTGSASGVVVIDVDPRNGGDNTLDEWYSWTGVDMPPTLRCQTGGDGRHILYKYPTGATMRSRQRVLPGIDIKGDGGYVITAPSLHHSGKRYRWLNPGAAVAHAPADLVAWLLEAKGSSVSPDGVGASGPDYSFRDALESGAPAGARDQFLNDLAFKCRRDGRSRAEAEAIITAAWEKLEQVPGDFFPLDHALYKVEHVWRTVEAPPALEPWQAAIAARLVRGALGRSVEPAPPASGDHQEEAAESGAGVGSSQRLPVEAAVEGGGSDSTTRPPRGPVVVGEPPDFESDLTHTGNAYRYVKLFGDQVLWVAGVGWHHWSGTRWVYDEKRLTSYYTLGVLRQLREEQRAAAGDDDAARRLGRFYEASSAERGRSAMLNLAAQDPRVAATVDELNVDPWLLVVENGTLDLRTGTLRESRPEDRNTHQAAVTYDANAKCPAWEEHVALVTARANGSRDPGMAAFVRRWVGYTLTGLASEQKLFFGHGEGNNGKNVLIETVMELLGTYAMKQSSKLVLGSGQEHETIVADLAGRRMVFIDETPKGKINDSRLKELTGSKRIRARKIAKDSFEFAARFKLWISGNNKPRVDDATEGFWRRVDLVPFDVEIPAERRVKDYGQVLKAEWSGILNWALEGLRDYREVGLGQVDRVAAAVAEYRDEENWFGQFVTDTFDVGSIERAWIPNKIIMRLLTEWCQGQGLTRVPTMMQIAKGDLERNGFIAEREPSKRRAVIWPKSSADPERGHVGPWPRAELLERLEIAWWGSKSRTTYGVGGNSDGNENFGRDE